MCRLTAREMSSLVPQLRENNVRLIGVGLDPVGVEDMRTSLYPSVNLIGVKTESAGVEEFIDRKFFAGDLFIDNKREVYKKLGFKRMGMMSLPKAVFAKKSRIAVAKAKSLDLGGNYTVGDGYQNGGCLVVEAGGNKTLFTFVQEEPADHPETGDILQALGIQTSI